MFSPIWIANVGTTHAPMKHGCRACMKQVLSSHEIAFDGIDSLSSQGSCLQAETAFDGIFLSSYFSILRGDLGREYALRHFAYLGKHPVHYGIGAREQWQNLRCFFLGERLPGFEMVEEEEEGEEEEGVAGKKPAPGTEPDRALADQMMSDNIMGRTADGAASSAADAERGASALVLPVRTLVQVQLLMDAIARDPSTRLTWPGNSATTVQQQCSNLHLHVLHIPILISSNSSCCISSSRYERIRVPYSS